jgi:hypothetical protein
LLEVSGHPVRARTQPCVVVKQRIGRGNYSVKTALSEPLQNATRTPADSGAPA